MPELIDRQALLKKIYDNPPERERMTVAEWYRKCIYEAPTIEPEVRRGEWQCIGEYEEFSEEMADYLCTNCGYIISRKKNLAKPKYCENCGARMDGGADNG